MARERQARDMAGLTTGMALTSTPNPPAALMDNESKEGHPLEWDSERNVGQKDLKDDNKSIGTWGGAQGTAHVSTEILGDIDSDSKVKWDRRAHPVHEGPCTHH